MGEKMTIIAIVIIVLAILLFIVALKMDDSSQATISMQAAIFLLILAYIIKTWQ